MYELKIEKNLPHHYMISVAMRTLTEKEPGKIYLKHGPLYFSNDDVMRMQSAAMLSKDKLFKTTSKKALEIFESTELATAISGMKLAAMANNCTIHHFSSKEKISDEWFETLVDRANKSKDAKKLLEESLRRFY